MHLPRRMLLLWAVTLCALAMAGMPSAPNQAKPAPKDRPTIPPAVERWLGGSDRSDFPWKVWLTPPRLTFQQRHLVQVRATISVQTLNKIGMPRTLLFFVKVGNERGNWFEDMDSLSFEVPSDLTGDQEIQFVTGIYIRPGNYVVAVIAHDSDGGGGNLWRGRLRVPSLGNDPLPELDDHFPVVEFVADVPKEVMTGASLSGGSMWPLAHARHRLVVDNAEPVRMDLVVNLSGTVAEPFAAGRQRAPSYGTMPIRSNMALQIGCLLSQLDLKAGCVRVSLLDVRRTEVLLERADSRTLDWDKLQSEVQSVDRHTVDVRLLENQTQASAFLNDFLNRITSDTGSCGPGTSRMQQVVVVVSQRLAFPQGTKLKRLNPEAFSHCRFYYFQGELGLAAGNDGTADMLKPIKPRQLTFNTPQSFRKALSLFLSNLRMSSAASQRKTPIRKP